MRVEKMFGDRSPRSWRTRRNKAAPTLLIFWLLYLACEVASDRGRRVGDNEKTVGGTGNKKPQHPFGSGVLKQRRVTLA